MKTTPTDAEKIDPNKSNVVATPPSEPFPTNASQAELEARIEANQDDKSDPNAIVKGCCISCVDERRIHIAAEILKTLIQVTNAASKWNSEKSLMEGPTYSWIVAGDVEASYVRQAYKYADELLAQEKKA